MNAPASVSVPPSSTSAPGPPVSMSSPVLPKCVFPGSGSVMFSLSSTSVASVFRPRLKQLALDADPKNAQLLRRALDGYAAVPTPASAPNWATADAA